MAKTIKQYYHLCSCLVLFRDKEGPDAQIMKTMPVNVVTANPGNTIGVREIARMHQAAQEKFWQGMGHEQMETMGVLNVIIQGIMPCGFMSAGEFNNMPSKQMQEMEPASMPQA